MRNSNRGGAEVSIASFQPTTRAAEPRRHSNLPSYLLRKWIAVRLAVARPPSTLVGSSSLKKAPGRRVLPSRYQAQSTIASMLVSTDY